MISNRLTVVSLFSRSKFNGNVSPVVNLFSSSEEVPNLKATNNQSKKIQSLLSYAHGVTLKRVTSEVSISAT